LIRQSRIAPVIMLDESLGASDLSGSPMAIDGMKVLTYAAEGMRLPSDMCKGKKTTR
jgi:hypothetical protein